MEKKVAMIMGLWAIGIMKILKVSSGEISCEEAIATLKPCLSYLVDIDPIPNSDCCLAVEKVNQAATTNLCVCFKQAALFFGVKLGKAKQLPNLCHVPVPFPIDPSFDCDKITALENFANGL